MSESRHPGDCFFHEQAPYELLHFLASSETGELWRCKPLFVDNDAMKDIFILHHQRCSKLHTTPRTI